MEIRAFYIFILYKIMYSTSSLSDLIKNKDRIREIFNDDDKLYNKVVSVTEKIFNC